MRPVSTQFLSTIRGSHQMVSRVQVITNFQTGVSPTGGVELALLDGDVSLDGSADVRGTADITVDGTNAFSRAPGSLLTPYGNELFIERGVVYGTGTRELVSQGYYKIYTVEQEGEPDSPIRLTARDRMSGIIDARLLAPIQFQAGTSISVIFDQLVHEVFPTAVIQYDFDAVASTLERDQIADEDRYGFLADLVKSRGKVMYWDYAGRLQVKDPPDPTAIVYEINVGRNGVLVSLSRELDREGVYNAVVAIGQAPDGVTAVRAIAMDMNPNSITFWNGNFGKVPRYYFSTFMYTTAQAANAAEKILAKSLGLPYNLNFTFVPNPALEPLDPIQITHEDGYEYHVLDKITIPLTYDGVMTASTREQTDTIIETDV